MVAQGDGEKDKVLVIDDDPAALVATIALLANDGYEVLSASGID